MAADLQLVSHLLDEYGLQALDVVASLTPRKPMTNDQIVSAFRKAFPVGGVVFTDGAIQFARAIEAAHGIKETE